MATLFYMALFGILLLFIMGIVSNSSQTSISRVEDQIYLMNCPLPLNGARPDPASLDIVGLTVNYTTLYDNSTDYHVTVFHCFIDPNTGAFSVNDEVYTATTSWFDTTTGTLFYASSTITALGQKAVAFLILLSFVLTPANFNVLGYGLDDLSGSALAVVVGVYLIAYVFITIWAYTTIIGAIGGLMP
jgi:hypothetical protein